MSLLRSDSGMFRTRNGVTHVGETTMRDRAGTRMYHTSPSPSRVQGIDQKTGGKALLGDRRMIAGKGFGSHYGRDFQPQQADAFWSQRTKHEAYYADRGSTGPRDYEAAPSVRYPEARGHKRDTLSTSYGDGMKRADEQVPPNGTMEQEVGRKMFVFESAQLRPKQNNAGLPPNRQPTEPSFRALWGGVEAGVVNRGSDRGTAAKPPRPAALPGVQHHHQQQYGVGLDMNTNRSWDDSSLSNKSVRFGGDEYEESPVPDKLNILGQQQQQPQPQRRAPSPSQPTRSILRSSQQHSRSSPALLPPQQQQQQQQQQQSWGQFSPSESQSSGNRNHAALAPSPSPYDPIPGSPTARFSPMFRPMRFSSAPQQHAAATKIQCAERSRQARSVMNAKHMSFYGVVKTYRTLKKVATRWIEVGRGPVRAFQRPNFKRGSELTLIPKTETNLIHSGYTGYRPPMGMGSVGTSF